MMYSRPQNMTYGRSKLKEDVYYNMLDQSLGLYATLNRVFENLKSADKICPTKNLSAKYKEAANTFLPDDRMHDLPDHY